MNFGKDQGNILYEFWDENDINYILERDPQTGKIFFYYVHNGQKIGSNNYELLLKSIVEERDIVEYNMWWYAGLLDETKVVYNCYREALGQYAKEGNWAPHRSDGHCDDTGKPIPFAATWCGDGYGPEIAREALEKKSYI